MARYVILFHECPSGYPRPTHWDLMLKVGGVLRTWALAQTPDSSTKVDAEALPDHRLDYLQYEGTLSGDRGKVTRWDHGTFEFESETPDEVVVRLSGERLSGVARLKCQRDMDHGWIFTFETRKTATGG